MSDNWIRETEYPEGAVKVARDRVRGLLHYSITSTIPVSKLLESAYLQGIVDATEIGAITVTVKQEAPEVHHLEGL